ncbi:MAG: PhzF family phenazine biosynthesis protein [Halobacteriota archaeon]
MNTRRALLVDAFTADPLSGNAAGVIPDASGLSVEQMQSIASELAVSETVFLLPSGSAERRARYFTPTREVDLCGHATIAAHAFLNEDGAIDAGTHTLETNAGDLPVAVEDDGVVWMTQAPPTVDRVELEYGRVASALGLDEGAFSGTRDDLPPAVASTGLPWVCLPVDFLEHLGAIDLDAGAIASLSDEYDAVGLYVFTFDTLDGESTLHARAFAPGAGIEEDPVTGTASGACGAYLRHVGAFDAMPEEMRFEQGHFVDRPGVVRVRVGTDVRVGGRAVTVLDGTLTVPDAEEDDGIIEV